MKPSTHGARAFPELDRITAEYLVRQGVRSKRLLFEHLQAALRGELVISRLLRERLERAYPDPSVLLEGTAMAAPSNPAA
jgi:hypothetical protein